jgi:hypothetical protein
MRSMRLFSISILRSSASRVFYIFFNLLFSLSRCFFASKFFVRGRAFNYFLAFVFIASRAFSSRVIACCNFSSAAVRYR